MPTYNDAHLQKLRAAATVVPGELPVGIMVDIGLHRTAITNCNGDGLFFEVE